MTDSCELLDGHHEVTQALTSCVAGCDSDCHGPAWREAISEQSFNAWSMRVISAVGLVERIQLSARKEMREIRVCRDCRQHSPDFRSSASLTEPCNGHDISVFISTQAGGPAPALGHERSIILGANSKHVNHSNATILISNSFAAGLLEAERRS